MVKKIPLRKCVVTQERLPKKDLLRIVKNNEGEVFVDLSSKANGRGAYIKNDIEVLEKAIANVSPDFEVKSRRVGGANYQIPFPIAGHRQLHFAFSWLVQSARARKGMPYAKRLEAEIVDAYNETGAAFKKNEACHSMAEANRAFAHCAR